MADTAAPASPKKVKKTTKPKAASSHPPVAQMVTAAIKALKDRKGSSLAAIKKYIAANYKCDVAKLSPFIRRFLKSAVEKGTLKQVKGTGASGSFKMGEEKAEKKPKAKKAVKAKSPKKPKAKKVAKKPKKDGDKPKKAKKAKTPKKAAAKPKKPKAKTPKKAKAAKPKAKKPAAKKAAKK